MLIRLVHAQGEKNKGALLITDIENGLPNVEHGLSHKQPVYLNFFHTAFGEDGKVHVDRSLPGHLDLVMSDKVRLSLAGGVIAGLEAQSLLTVTEIPTGAFNVPTIVSATYDGTVSSESIAIVGTSFISYDPDATSVSMTDGTDTKMYLATGSKVTVGSATSITVDATTLGFVPTEVTVSANGKSISSVVS